MWQTTWHRYPASGRSGQLRDDDRKLLARDLATVVFEVGLATIEAGHRSWTGAEKKVNWMTAGRRPYASRSYRPV